MIIVNNKEVNGQFVTPADSVNINVTITPRRGFLYLCDNNKGEILDLIKVKLYKNKKPKFYIKNRINKTRTVVKKTIVELQLIQSCDDIIANKGKLLTPLAAKLDMFMQMISNDLESDDLVVPSYKIKINKKNK